MGYELKENGVADVLTIGMSKWELADLEISNVPEALIGYAHGILFELTGYSKNNKPLLANENLGGYLAHGNQRLVNFATFRTKDTRLEVLDIENPETGTFPRRLFASYLTEGALNNRNRSKRREELRLAIDCHKEFAILNREEIDAQFKEGKNVNNYGAFQNYGDELLDIKDDSGWDYIFEAVRRCPSFALDISNDIKSQFGDNLPDDERFQFWAELDEERIEQIIKTTDNNRL